MKDKDKDNKKEIYTVGDLVSMYKSYYSAKEKITKKWNVIKSFVNGEFWEKFKSKIKDYTLTPDTNYVEYVVSAYINSIYSGTYIPEIIGVDLDDNQKVNVINAFLEKSWINEKIKSRSTVWGENVTLYNMQPVKTVLTEKDGKKIVKMEDISPFDIFLDPSVSDFKEGQAIFISKEVSIYSLLRDNRFKTKVKEIINNPDNKIFSAVDIGRDYDRFETTGNKTVSVLEYFIKHEKGIENGFILNEKYCIYKKTDITLKRFPINILYQRIPNGNPYGISVIYKIINSYIVLNILDSMDATQPYLAQNRPKFFDIKSRINPTAFKDYGNSPNATFALFGDPSKGVYYQDIQYIPDTTNIKNRLEKGIFDITGVDPAYKGRQTNSITTTGGVEAQQARVVMLTDNAPIVSLEVFIEELAYTWVEFHINFIKDIKLDNSELSNQTEIEFKDMSIDNFKFILESKPYLPITKHTRFELLKQLYEMQGQYNFQIKIIQEEDLIDELPLTAIQKNKLLQRITGEKQNSKALERRTTLLTFASLFQKMIQEGFSEEEAANNAMQIMDEESMAMQQDPSLGVNPTMMSPQGGTPQL